MQHKKTALLLIGAGVILSGIFAFVFFSIQRRPSNTDLSLFAPEHTVLAIYVQNRSILKTEHHLIAENPSLISLQSWADHYWSSLETKLAMPVDQMMWLMIPDRDQPHAAVVIHFSQRPADTQIWNLTQGVYPDQVFGDASEFHLYSLTPTIAVLSDLPDTTFLNIQHRVALRSEGVLRFFAAPPIQERFAQAAGVSGLDAMTAGQTLSVSLDSNDRIMTLHSSGIGTSTDPYQFIGLRLPEQYSFAADGGIIRSSGIAETNPVQKLIAAWSQGLAERYNLPSDVMQDQLRGASGLIISEDSWLIASTHEDELVHLGETLASSFNPSIHERILPDKSILKEYVKKAADPATTTMDGMEVSVWFLRPTSTAPTGELSQIPRLILGKNSDYFYLTNSPTLHRSQQVSGGKTMISTAGEKNCTASQAGVIQQAIMIADQKLGILAKKSSFFMGIALGSGEEQNLEYVYCTD